MNPTIGRIVHFATAGVHYAAVVVKVWSPTCANLYVMPNGSDPMLAAKVITSVCWATPEANQDYSWHWPEQENA
jgi:hypothetical protein